MKEDIYPGSMMFLLAPTDGSMRIRVDTKYGYASYSMSDRDRALEYFANEGMRLRLCKDIYDDGYVIADSTTIMKRTTYDKQ